MDPRFRHRIIPYDFRTRNERGRDLDALSPILINSARSVPKRRDINYFPNV
jgi:hypothetical protein